MNLNIGRLNKKKSNKCHLEYNPYPHHRKINAGTLFESGIHYYYNHRKRPQPEIAFIQFVSKSATVSCGIATCPTPAPRTTTMPKSTTPKPTVPALAGNSCDPFVKIKPNQNPGEKGVILINVPKNMRKWQLTVSLTIILSY